MTPASLTACARHFLFVRETEPNHGAWVEFFQRFCNGMPGDSYCCDFVSFIEDVAYHGHAPTVRTGSCQHKLSDAEAKGYVVDDPAVDDLYFFVDRGVAHHVGIVTGLDPLTGLAANTSPDGLSTNGTGVFEHQIPIAECVLVRLPTV
jgi:hypothetical protein